MALRIVASTLTAPRPFFKCNKSTEVTGAFDQCANGASSPGAQYEVTLPVAGNCSVVGLSRPV